MCTKNAIRQICKFSTEGEGEVAFFRAKCWKQTETSAGGRKRHIFLPADFETVDFENVTQTGIFVTDSLQYIVIFYI